MEAPFEAAEKMTLDAEEGVEVVDVPGRSLEALQYLCMGK